MKDYCLFVEDVRRFMNIGGNTTEGYNPRQTALYTGLQAEEFAEKLEAIGFHPSSPIVSILHNVSKDLKDGLYDNYFHRADREGMLDADIDLAWVSFGSAFSQGADVVGAAACVADSNHAKFPNGECIRDKAGKIQKPAGWTPPDLAPYVIKKDD